MDGNEHERKRVLVTGADGLIGRLVMEALDDEYELIGLARNLSGYATVIADISDLAALLPVMEGVDAVVHLAATSAVESPWARVLPDNLIGTYNVFEAARRAGVERVIFASSNHAIGTYETENAPALYELGDGRAWDHHADIRPDSLYGVSKVFGEALGRFYADHHGLRVFCLRIGGVRDPEDPSHPNQLWADMGDTSPETVAKRKRMRAVWLSERDCVQLITRCLESDERWALVYGISDNPRQFWDLGHARGILEYAPRDGAPEAVE
ncbi:MAG: NAD(P)-dependent oxidoreductase [Chloroflexia bacterium]|nr:NAD(P)-dependent oxidoreductase [Chloroflexia bacterium]